MDAQVFRRILHGLGANAYGQVIVVVIQLAGVPLLLHYWGARLYGEWLILFAIPAYLSMTDLGFSQSAANDMTARIARGDRAGALSVFQSLSALICLLVAAGLLLVTLFVAFLPIGDWMHFVAMPVSETRWILWLLMAEVLIKLAEGVNHAGFRAGNEYALHSVINYTTLLFQQAGVWFVAVLGYGPVAAAACFLVVRLIVTPVVTVLLFQRHRFLEPGFEHARMAELRALVQPALANVAAPVAQALNIQGMVLVVGAVLGPLAVVTFSTLRTMTRLVLQMVGILSHAFEPEAAAAFGRGDRALMRRLFIRMLLGQAALSFAGLVFLDVFGKDLFKLWTFGRVAMDSSLFFWLLASAAASVFWHGAFTILKSANRHIKAAFLFVAGSAGSVILAWFLLHRSMRLADAGLALLLTDFLMASYMLYAARRLIQNVGKSGNGFTGKQAKPKI